MEISFKFNFRHTTESGFAEVVKDLKEGMDRAYSFHDYSEVMKSNRLGRTETIDGNYDVYETYVDSGSNHYYYFAFPV